MTENWAAKESKSVALGDDRLNRRYGEILRELGSQPGRSIPAAVGGSAEMAAAYRFLDNSKVEFAAILEAHIDATRQRMAQESCVLLVQDTTTLDLTRPAQQVEGAGPIHGDSNRRGLMLHLLVALSSTGVPLGVVYAEIWARADEPRDSGTESMQPYRKRVDIEMRESMRWIEAMRWASELASEDPDREIICICDSEADIYELIDEAEAGPENLRWLIRGSHNRAVRPTESCDSRLLKEQVQASPVQRSYSLDLPTRTSLLKIETRRRKVSRDARTAEIEVRACSVELCRPQRSRGEPRHSINVVMLSEVTIGTQEDPEDPLEWMLLSNLAIEDQEQVDRVIALYQQRWSIEVFFRTLKSGCGVEKHRFTHVDRSIRMVAICLVITWRTLYVSRLGRDMEDLCCTVIFAEEEWKGLYQLHFRRRPPKKPPALQEMVCMLAELGGYVNTPSRGHPGAQTIWIGMQRLNDIAACWLAFAPSQ